MTLQPSIYNRRFQTFYKNRVDKAYGNQWPFGFIVDMSVRLCTVCLWDFQVPESNVPVDSILSIVYVVYKNNKNIMRPCLLDCHAVRNDKVNK